MNIWLINHYAVPPKYYPLARTTCFAKYLMRMGHTVTIFAASSVHNSDINLITDRALYREETVDGIHYVYVRCRSYTGNGRDRIINMFEFSRRLGRVCAHFPKPNAMLSSSATPPACMAGLKLARKYGIRTVGEVSDLWPETLVALKLLSARNPLLIPMYAYEKRMYRKADALIFTMEGAYDYIVERGWEKAVPRDKVFYINNGVDLEAFDKNVQLHRVEDPDLDDPDTFKLVYAGSIRRANGLEELVECAAQLRDQPKIRFLVYGGGEDLESLRVLCQERRLKNLVFKGRVGKERIPYILSRCDAALLNYAKETVKIFRYGSSNNKLFEYLAAGKPVISNARIAYSPIERDDCGAFAAGPSVEDYVRAVLKVYELPQEEYTAMCQNARRVAQEYDFKNLTRKLIDVIEGVEKP